MTQSNRNLGAGTDARLVETRCPLCRAVQQYATNWLLLWDLALNTLLGGEPKETVSERTARARDAGSEPARRFCAALTWVWKHVFRHPAPDHCSWALEGPGSVGRELWHWSPDPPPPALPPPERGEAQRLLMRSKLVRAWADKPNPTTTEHRDDAQQPDGR